MAATFQLKTILLLKYQVKTQVSNGKRSRPISRIQKASTSQTEDEKKNPQLSSGSFSVFLPYNANSPGNAFFFFFLKQYII